MRTKSQRGGVLLVVTILIAIIFLAIGAKHALDTIEFRLKQNTGIHATLNKIDLALINFVMQHKRLPCPADGRIVTGQINAGKEMPFPACTTQAYGVVPWLSLGLTENDARDPWTGLITYRVDPALAGLSVRLMDMSLCDISGTGSVGVGGTCRTPTPPCATNPTSCTAPTTFLASKGLDVWDGIGGAVGFNSRANNRTLGSGAAYVIISHGNSKDNLTAGTDEQPNLNNANIAIPATQTNTYRDAPFNSNGGASNFDDFVSHPKIQDILIKANLNNRVH